MMANRLTGRLPHVNFIFSLIVPKTSRHPFCNYGYEIHKLSDDVCFVAELARTANGM
jgi:hypothetical protein